MKNRNETIDVAKGIAILLMLIGHSSWITNNWSNWVFYVIFSFHMPLFYIFSGYFYKPKQFREVFIGGVHSLVKPYFVTGAISLLILVLIDHLYAYSFLKGLFVGTLGNYDAKYSHWPLQAGPIWFLLSLFWCKLYFNFIYHKFSRFYFEISIALSFVFLYIGKHYLNLPLCIGSGFASLVFYAIGKKLRDYSLDEVATKNLFLNLVVWMAAVHYTTLNLAQYICKLYPLSVAGALCGTLVVYIFSTRISGAIARLLSLIGKQTLTILCCHGVAFAVSNEIVNSSYFINIPYIIDILYLILTIVCIVIVVLYKKVKSNTNLSF